MNQIEITPLSRPLDATVSVPGSKSITNRAMLLAAMAQGRSVIDAALMSDDTRYMTGALRALGFIVESDEAACRITVGGRGGIIPHHGAEIFVGGAGTVMRFLAAMLTLGQGRFRIDGNQRMRQRPIGPLLDAMQRLGASIYSERDNNCPPVIVDMSRGRFEGGETSIDARVSSQFVSAMLMPAPIWKSGLRLRVIGETARPFIDMTLRLMEAWGVHGSRDGDLIVVPGGQWYRAQRFAVEPDASSASYFAAAAALIGGTVRIKGLTSHSVQGDLEFLGVLQRMGARVAWHPDFVEVIGTGQFAGVDVAMNSMPDMVPTLAAIAPFASSPTIIRNVAFIRHHESDRIRVLATELRRLGASVIDKEDGLEIQPSTMHPATIETYDDHRIAMSFAIAGLKLRGVTINDPGCVAKTFPDFFERLAMLEPAA
ncbi:MAG: 3-phosphoshikimate 1-carboxyvinyltransferase [Candidatus Binatus sp.]|uniref:3-phosphoshikimate 1-carboxyvinyltransferase n=1 Tax=Candidatus Binatus sp. TaxID=2811406 RepID=UPI002725B8BB|nr:3-phosphoshikimate 1-carboxyvinyltransferase [Candidatus Binatus sp.]MDO8431844.1 3-phosphoshikimate 1-carboxyvinyltransferase [Candidatus Binatus sp.]